MQESRSFMCHKLCRVWSARDGSMFAYRAEVTCSGTAGQNWTLSAYSKHHATKTMLPHLYFLFYNGPVSLQIALILVGHDLHSWLMQEGGLGVWLVNDLPIQLPLSQQAFSYVLRATLLKRNLTVHLTFLPLPRRLCFMRVCWLVGWLV